MSTISITSAGAQTPGSVSSIKVEAGSDTSGHGHLADLEGDSDAGQTGSRAGDSPLSSPIIDAVNIDLVEPSEPLSLGDLSSSPSQPLKGPLDSLRAPPRHGSTTSLSSMAVEAGSTIAPEDADVSTPSAETPGELPTTAGGPAEDDDHTPVLSETEREQDDVEREKATKLELEQYEQEKNDPPAAPSPVPRDATPSLAATIDPSEMTEPAQVDEFAGEGEPVAPAAAEASHDAPQEAAMAEVKCSDCNRSISLLDLADHKCEAQDQPPALLGSPVVTPVLDSAPKMTRTRSALSELSDMAGAPRDPNIKVAPPLSRSSSSKLGFTASPAQTLDQFVPQTSDVVPADIDDDLDEHFTSGTVPQPGAVSYPVDVDDNGDSRADSPTLPRNVSHPTGLTSSYGSSNDIPQDFSDNENDNFGAAHDASTFQAARSVLLEAGKRRASTATNATPTKSPTVSRSTSMHSATSVNSNGSYARRNVPGYYDENSDEEDYEGGSVTIVRTTATHRVA